ncbi:hypothetical protein Nepgr_017084 [Nepenthes gracilis]|uniref:Uncharacterized protein n=1 Tax=Nepenthes gracilis TaxID=150966 RepID=A0AAD3SNS2_NEPGR|nr:hypothetical protein Nepgr_017084 [Nepenthes gracilis]
MNACVMLHEDGDPVAIRLSQQSRSPPRRVKLSCVSDQIDPGGNDINSVHSLSRNKLDDEVYHMEQASMIGAV